MHCLDRVPKEQARQPPGKVTGPGLVLNDPGGARTHDLLIKSQLLCQLSYRVTQSLIPLGHRL